MKLSRHDERVLAFQMVFEQIVTGESSGDILVNAYDGRDVETSEFTRELFLKVEENAESIDEVIKKNLQGWSISRLSKVAYAALRVAVCELYYMPDIPISVTIDEAVQIAKEYGGTDNSSYVNGVLSTIAKENSFDKTVKNAEDKKGE